MKFVQHMTIMQEDRRQFANLLSDSVIDGWSIISSGATATSDGGTWWAILEKAEY